MRPAAPARRPWPLAKGFAHAPSSPPGMSYSPAAPSVPAPDAPSAASTGVPLTAPSQIDASGGRVYICGGGVAPAPPAGTPRHTRSLGGRPVGGVRLLRPRRRACYVHHVRTLPHPAECGDKVVLNSADAVSCRSCMCRILYKARTTRSTSPGLPTAPCSQGCACLRACVSCSRVCPSPAPAATQFMAR